MTTATISTKGQVTIPMPIRKSLQLQSGDRVAFDLQEDGLVVMRIVSRKARQVYGMLHQPDQPSVSVEEMDAAVAQHITEQSTE